MSRKVQRNKVATQKNNRDRVLATRSTPFIFPTGIIVRTSKDISLIDFIDGDNDKILTSVAITKGIAKTMYESLESFLDKEKDNEGSNSDE